MKQGFHSSGTVLFFSWVITNKMKVELKYKTPVLVQFWIDSIIQWCILRCFGQELISFIFQSRAKQQLHDP